MTYRDNTDNETHSGNGCEGFIDCVAASGDNAVGVAAAAASLLVGGDRGGLGDDAVGVTARAAGLLVGGRVDDDGGGGKEGVHCDVGCGL